MNWSNIGTSLIQYTNLVLLLENSTADFRKFAAWEADNPENEVLTGLEIIDVSFEDNIKIFEHPLETGVVITDHIIVDPNEVTLQALIDITDSDTYNELYNYYLSGTALKIRAENKVIPKAIIKSKPFKLSADHFDKTAFSITFREVQEVTPAYVGMPKAQSASSTSRVNSGVKQAKESTKKASWLYSTLHGSRT